MSTTEERVIRSGCSVALPSLVYAWTKTKEEFDTIALPETIHEWKEDQTISLLRGDGRTWERRTFIKALDGGPVHVIFQWSEERPLDSKE